MIRVMCFLIGLFVPFLANAEAVFSEALLNSWGYETTKVQERHQIKSIKNHSKSGPAFYARFDLWKECLETVSEATAKIEAIETERVSTLMGQQKDYQRMIQASECIYFIKTYSNHTYLSFQPQLMERIRSYVSSANS